MRKFTCPIILKNTAVFGLSFNKAICQDTTSFVVIGNYIHSATKAFILLPRADNNVNEERRQLNLKRP
jgi:hypothetical protein